MKIKTNIKLELSDLEKENLRKKKIKKSNILDFSYYELAAILNVSEQRAKEIYALADFQRIPSIALEFAKDLVFLDFYDVEELIGENGPEFFDLYEKKKGYKVDPCVEDQFRLVVDFARNKDYSKNWWDFTMDRKIYRSDFGYPEDRPKMYWNKKIDNVKI
jgi:hypothetical protein